jgi:arginyl-tRNA synthetase
MNLFAEYRGVVVAAVQALQQQGALPAELKTDAITLEPPRDPLHGDMATNAAMVLAGQAKQKPRDIAEKLAEHLRAADGITEVDIAGPGFINIRLQPGVWRKQIAVMLRDGNSYGNSSMGAGKRVNVEYVSANPTGPLHIGHARGAVYGDALATLLLKAGYNVTKEYYINDAGAQIAMLVRSALLRYREACGEVIGEIPEGLYPGEYLKGVGEALKESYGDKLRELAAQPSLDKSILPLHLFNLLDEVIRFSVDCMMALIRADLADMGIVHDVFTSEAALHAGKKIEAAIEILREKGHVEKGVLEPPKGEAPEDWEAKEQLLFLSTKFGDDMDRTIAKSDGSYTYFAGDLALTMDKINRLHADGTRGFEQLIYMFGADHGGYVKRMEASAAALSDNTVHVDIKLCQLVHLFKKGEPVRMSKRAGNFVTVRDVLDEVGKDILRFVMLMRKTNQDMEFDLDKVKEQSKDNPVFYVQYAHARAKSLLRMAREQVPEAVAASEAPTEEHLALLTHPEELALIRLLASYPRVIEQAASAHEPHRIIYYVQEVAAQFHGLWNIGHGDSAIRFVQADNPLLTTARLSLARAMASVVASGLNLCGVTPVEELRG